MYPYIEASLYRRKGDLNKRWYVEFGAWWERFKRIEKKKIYCPAKFKTEHQREVWAKEICYEINNALRQGAVYEPAEKISIAPKNKSETITMESPLFKTMYRQLEVSKHLRGKSSGTYKSAINSTFEFFHNTDFPIYQLTKPLILSVRDYFINDLDNLAITANKKMEHFNRIFKEVLDRAGEKENPFSGIKKLVETEVSKSNIAFTRDDQLTLETWMKKNDPDLFRFTRYMYYAFIRPKELRQLHIIHLDIVNRIITVPGEIAKNRKTRNIHVINPLIEFLPESILPVNYLFGKDLEICKYRTSENVAYRRHLVALEKCGLLQKDYTLYSWRHTGAVRAYYSGVGLRELQLMFAHAKMDETVGYLKSLGLRTDPNIQNYSW